MSVLPFGRRVLVFTFLFSSLFLCDVFSQSGMLYPSFFSDSDFKIDFSSGAVVAKAKKEKKSKKTETPKEVEPEEDFVVDSDSVKLNVPNKYNSYFFRGISEQIIKQLENGTPVSILNAVNSLKRNSAEYSEAEKTVLYVADGIMRIVWPTEKRGWEVPAVSQDNAYVGAINSAEKGVYDFSTGNMDFLTLVLPSLVLLTSNSRNDYYDTAQTSLMLAVKMNENSVLVNYLLALLLRRMGQEQQALPYFEKAWSNSKN